ncbi:glycosyltransferase family 2 protein [Sediminispirochaeta bajacaliforniensis]|uniref:glycosyltransferase family 2 protein n=1 Tax=Sediminispirochaeta bajacaliforniensis TaxID=148 RepID=UPI00036787F2|nr:glycosyltransferase family 2 protein [Sediminispirochaeta bajacaliforniensis]
MDLLQILIPTYNRIDFLAKNINLLDTYICELGLLNKVSILISDNASQDGTIEKVKSLQSEKTSSISVLSNNENVGLEKNAVKVLENATAEYVMYLGDDDFISKEYLENVAKIIEKRDVKCIIPSYVNIDIYGNQINGGRDRNTESQLIGKGYLSASKAFIKGHQLSGIVFLREGTLSAYLEASCRNIYLFMFFVGYNIIRGDAFHLTSYPVRVSQPGQAKKDWNYGKDGLFNEKFKNSTALFKKHIYYRFIAEKSLIRQNNSRRIRKTFEVDNV